MTDALRMIQEEGSQGEESGVGAALEIVNDHPFDVRSKRSQDIRYQIMGDWPFLLRALHENHDCRSDALAYEQHEYLVLVANVLFTFYDFPAQHWPHLRTTNPIESTFATVRLRTHRTKGCGSRIATLTMVFKLALEAQKHWRRLQGFELIPKVVVVVQFVDGEEQTQQAA
jgi:hypothetical protein